jgi:hypothetical protein
MSSESFKLSLISQVASQMMKSGRPGRLIATKKQKDNFQLRHEKQIIWAIENLPRSSGTRSAALPAVVVKCLIKYDGKLVAKFCKAIRDQLFQGQDDPAFLLWKFLQNSQGRETVAVYARAVCAAKAYMEGRTLTRLQPIKDIFTWDENWTVPDELLKNWNPDVVPKTDSEQQLEQVSH